MDNTEYKSICASFRGILGRYAVQLSKESKESVQHFIEVAEIEMACESFILSLLEEKIQLPVEVKRNLRDLALGLQLDKESVFRADFWKIVDPFLRSEE